MTTWMMVWLRMLLVINFDSDVVEDVPHKSRDDGVVEELLMTTLYGEDPPEGIGILVWYSPQLRLSFV